MPKELFNCPDGVAIKISSCLQECRMGDRCCPEGFLKMQARERPVTSPPSVTELIRGTRQASLMRTYAYAVTPAEEIWAVWGTKAHDNVGSDEKSLEWNGITGTPDEENDDTLIDYKFVGSYKAMQALGMEAEEIDTGEFYKNGRRKTRKVYHQTGEPQTKEWDLQLNIYKIMKAEKANKIYSFLRVFMGIRDGGTKAAFARGINKSSYYINIPILNEQHVKTYFLAKKEALERALKTGESQICTPEEAWDGRRCESYCPVAKWCRDNHYLRGDHQEVE